MGDGDSTTHFRVGDPKLGSGDPERPFKEEGGPKAEWVINSVT